MPLFPELELLGSPEDRHEVYRLALRELGRRWQFLVYAGVVASAAVLCAFAGMHVLGRVFPLLTQYREIVVGCAAGVALPLTFIFVFLSGLRRSIRELVRRGVPVCVMCGYDLRGQEIPRCPECGTDVAALKRESESRLN